MEHKILQIVLAPAGMAVRLIDEEEDREYFERVVCFALTENQHGDREITPMGLDGYGNVYDVGGHQIVDPGFDTLQLSILAERDRRG